MIHTCRQSPKFKTLVRRIRPLIGNCIIDAESVTVAILERLWHAATAGAKRGDIGKFDNELIAEECGWMGDADQLIDALVECGFLDVCEQHRLVVHDWDEHSPKHVKGVVKRQGGFVKPVTRAVPQPPHGKHSSGPSSHDASSEPRVNDLGSTTQGHQPKSATLDPLPPNLTKPNQTKPNHHPQTPSRSDGGGGGNFDEVFAALSAAEVVSIEPVVDKLRERSVSPAHAMAIVEHWRSRDELGPGALRTRLSNAIGGDDPAKGWPAEKNPPKGKRPKVDTIEQFRTRTINAAKGDEREELANRDDAWWQEQFEARGKSRAVPT